MHGRRVPGQVAFTARNRPCRGDAITNIGHQLAQAEIGGPSSSTGRESLKELEESPLRKNGRGGTVYSDQQAIPTHFHPGHGMQTQQDDNFESLEP